MEQLFTTAVFHAPMIKDMSLLAQNGAKVYTYEFAYNGSMTLCDVFRLTPIKLFVNYFGRHIGTALYQKDLGVCHGDDLFYLFPFALVGFPKSLRSRADKLTSQRFLTILTNFAARGQPGAINNVQWMSLPMDASVTNFPMLKIGKELEFMPRLETSQEKRNGFWIDQVQPNEKGTCWSHDPISQIYHVIAERRSSLLDSTQLYT